MAVETLKDVARSTLESAWFYELQQRLTVGAVDSLHGALAEELADDPPDSVLDICCGIGGFADVTPASYLGLDLNARYIDRARARHAADPSRQFLVSDALTCPLEDGQFHTSMVLNALHHFDDAGARQLLELMRRVTRRRLIIADPAPETWKPVARLLIAMDQGRYMRRSQALGDLVRQAGFEVLRERTFFRGFAHCRLMVCA